MLSAHSALDLDVLCSGPMPHACWRPKTPREAVQQGYSAAEQERRRFNLGGPPVRYLQELLVAHRIRVATAELPPEVSCLYLHAAGTGYLVLVNRKMPVESQRCCYAHGYAHPLFHAERQSVFCRQSDRGSLIELRASSFAGRLLVPERAVRQYLQSLGKERLGRAGGATQRMPTEQRATPATRKQRCGYEGAADAARPRSDCGAACLLLRRTPLARRTLLAQ